MSKMVYFDRVATALMAKEAVKAITEFLQVPVGNPSAHIHSAGITAAKYIDEARHKVADLVNAKDNEIYFTSGATESNNLAIKGYISGKNEGEIIISEIEHYSILDQVRTLSSLGFEIKFLKVDRFGMVNPDDLGKLITSKTVLVSVMMANPEIGTIQPVKELAKVCGHKGVVFHTDATSAVGYIPVDVTELGVNMMTISSQVLGGPMGTGALYIDKKTILKPIFDGGNQERGYRPGTENVAGIVGFGAACE
ncbi:MAG: cysteine desulfurase NifS, partial [Candidatus Zixiibacteriota bacterium]